MILTFEPYLKPVLWGGNKITALKGLPKQEGIGESWEISVVPGHESVVKDGEYKGRNLADLCREMGEKLVGADAKDARQFPLLIKLIDARQDLSVQVHPDDALAQRRHNCAGKTEMWYVVDNEDGAKIYSGLSAPLDAEGYQQRVADNTIMDVIDAHGSQRGQFYFIPAGTIHAIGAGNLIAEIQQSSDITYRVYDYDRRDAQGNPRELHTQLAADAIDYRYPNPVEPTARVVENQETPVVQCQYFKTWIRTGAKGRTLELHPAGKTFVVAMCLDGEVALHDADGTDTVVSSGSSVLIAADTPTVVAEALRDHSTLLLTTLG